MAMPEARCGSSGGTRYPHAFPRSTCLAVTVLVFFRRPIERRFSGCHMTFRHYEVALPLSPFLPTELCSVRSLGWRNEQFSRSAKASEILAERTTADSRDQFTFCFTHYSRFI